MSRFCKLTLNSGQVFCLFSKNKILVIEYKILQ